MPRYLCSQVQYNRKLHALNNMYTTTHWPCNIVYSPNEPLSFGSSTPGYTPIPKPVLTDLGMKIAGL